LEVTFPDLVMTAVASTTPQVNTKGGYINVSDTLTNQGSVASTASVRVGYYLSTDNVITSTDTFLGYRSVYTVAAGASNTNAGYGYYANVPAGLAPGTYYLGAIADYSGLEAETDETNNGLVSATSTLEVTLPDLVMTAVGSTTSQINTAGGPIYVSDTLKNQGPVASTVGVRVGYYLSTDDVITTADTFLGYRTSYSTLAAGASNSVTSTYVTVPAGLTVGSTYYLGAIADYTGLEAETDETNNALAGEGATITVTQPDLVMTAVGSTTSQVNTAGGYIYVSDTLKNQGAVASTVSVRVGYYLSTDNIITTADTFLGYRTASTVAAGASNSVASSYVTIPAGLTVGSTYYLGAIVDYTGLEAETDETNNALAGVGSTITVTQPDLVMTAVGSTATQAAPGGLINVSDTLTNQGPVASTAGVRVGYYLSTDNVITTADTFLGYRSVGTLAAGANSTNSGANYATIPAATAVGTYYLGAIADYSGLQAETDETNNALVGPTIAIGPDLIMTGVSSASTTAVPGSGILIADTLKNQGAGATGSGCRQIGYYLSTDATITGADTLIGSREYCGALAANGSNNGAATSATIPANLAAGSYYLGAIADHTGVDAETDETNNSLSGSTLLLTLLPNAPGNVTASGGNASATVTFTAPVDNGGSAITGYTVTASPAGGVDSNAGTPGLSHVITGLANGTAYTFTVIATNNAGNSNASAASNSVTPATVPGAPVIGSAVANNAQASVTFSAPADNGGAIITGYTVSSLPAGGVDNNAGTTGLNHIITGLTNGTAYTFTVKASNSAGNSAASAASNSVTPSISAPNAPTNVIAAGGNTQASVGFSAPTNDGGSAITGYTVSSNPAGLVDSNAGTTSLTHLMTGLVGGTTYTFTVTATNAAGSSAPSVPSNSVTAGGSAVQAYYVYTDHLDTPRQITDTSGNIVWQWDSSDPFGNNVPNENPTGQGTFTCNLRHPGQYFDIETGLFQNFHRDYDSATGRYIQSDPIGLRGGINGYTYVENNPLSKIDPTGEFAFILPALPAIGSWIAANAANIGIGVGLGVLMSTPGDTADSPEKKADRNAYHKVCDEPPPPNLNECDDIRWKIGRANRCIGMRKAYMSKWNDEYEGHYNQIANRESELARLERLLKEKCCGK
ncbi:MAG: fibronectin type III domain-containing protein, partial [Gammaproteobacteria bacterium]|nr:fibronectin type III domain-containing protein [Gammaproteobacteria bacterium]